MAIVVSQSWIVDGSYRCFVFVVCCVPVEMNIDVVRSRSDVVADVADVEISNVVAASVCVSMLTMIAIWTIGRGETVTLTQNDVGALAISEAVLSASFQS